jgi:prepilin signal peptidase PulO-like enzyme (type II secretory pathway)
MAFIIGLISFILGTVVGSFLNVVSLRHNTGRGLSGRSFCFTCGKTLKWYELIPVLSFVVQKGKCRTCKSIISWQYPIVEVLTGVLFLGLSQKFLDFFILGAIVGVGNFYGAMILCALIIYAVLFGLLIAIGVYDLKHKIIPNKLVYIFISVAFIRVVGVSLINIFVLGDTLISVLPNLLSGPIVALPLFLVWFLSSGRAMGFGDVKLALGLGWMMSLWGALAALMISFWVGGIVGIILLSLFSKKITMKTEVPFAPFLISGTILAFFFNINVFSFLEFFG